MKINWTRNGKQYSDPSGRFTIANTSLGSRPEWVLFDRARKDTCVPTYTWTRYCSTLAIAKATAERILRGVDVR
jgi:hypothetical protein